GVGPRQYRVEYWREVTRRGVDNTEHLGCSGLLRECFVALGCALSKLGSGLNQLSFELSVCSPFGDPRDLFHRGHIRAREQCFFLSYAKLHWLDIRPPGN